ncbi:trypsin [Longimycelium tulufanense]|uniref:trypsin n=1 Tax=Longimycelium tulufanense TaxID=907463 RepID=A0A8J3C7S5_9PSEU|nr:trypsin-like serine protease [Longimycelium tulufanense]GGM50423.1 trypsin [Longimycelium tulufanense]
MRFVRMLSAFAGAAALAVSSLGVTTPMATAQTHDDATPFIIGGQEVDSAPWAARMFLNGRQRCSASIIAPQWILSARHCVEGRGTFAFRIGNVDQFAGVYAEAKPGGIHKLRDSDIALVNIDRPVQTEYAPLGNPRDVQAGQTVQIYGWGATRRTSDEINWQSRILKVANVRVTSTTCRNQLGGPNVCVRRVDGIAAGGDSGGPMFSKSPVDGKVYQVGVASTSDRQSFSTYANITAKRQWIKSVSGV